MNNFVSATWFDASGLAMKMAEEHDKRGILRSATSLDSRTRLLFENIELSVVSAPVENCLSCGAPPDGTTKCAYCGRAR